MQDVMQPVHSSVTRWRKCEPDKIPLLGQSLEQLLPGPVVACRI